MMTSNSSEPVGTTGSDAASAGQSSDTTNTPATTPESTSTPQAAATTPTTPSVGDGQTPAIVPPAFQPTFKFKAFGKEHELDDFWKPLVKDQESEKKVKELFTRAYAFDDLKTRFEGTQNEHAEVYKEYTALDRDVRKVTSFLNRGDLDNFFKSVGLDDDKIYNWVEQKIQRQNLPPEQRQALESQASERQRAYDLEMEKSELAEQYQTQAVQHRTMQLDMVLGRPEVSQAASAWDSRMGQLGAFRDLVVEEAQKAWYVEKTDLSAEQAAQRVLTKYGKLIESGGIPPQAGAPQAPQVQSPGMQSQGKPVIPAVQGRGTSPIKKSPKSIEDLKQMAREFGS
jgi:hypothetical protein